MTARAQIDFLSVVKDFSGFDGEQRAVPRTQAHDGDVHCPSLSGARTPGLPS